MTAILWPMAIQVGLTFALLIAMGRARVGAIRKDPPLMKRTAIDLSAFPERPRQIANAFHNQFQLPVLFYVACILLLMAPDPSPLGLIAAWVFVALRLVHAVIHTTGNNVRMRFYAFGAGMVALMAVWVFALHAAAKMGGGA